MNLKTILLFLITILNFAFSVNAQETEAFKATLPETKQKTHEQKVYEYHRSKLSKQINTGRLL